MCSLSKTDLFCGLCKKDQEGIYHTALGNILVKKGENSSAINHFSQAIELGDPAAANNLATTYRIMGDFQKSSEAYGKYIDMVGYLDDYAKGE